MKFGVATFITDQGIAPAPLGRADEERGLDSSLIAEHTHIPGRAAVLAGRDRRRRAALPVSGRGPRCRG
ncbi:hypothetical protein San01_08480 [Streptomyces angustmyceticus]|uniref:Luciferase-like domain-containing protein n=1 Tax=Streptomyces angustmyceticus TaxID=285578 RepID=A0A5J4L932_9ACTN|nr:hypothetical protein San01_08480 [Streptomyces angustmyceticus]